MHAAPLSSGMRGEMLQTAGCTHRIHPGALIASLTARDASRDLKHDAIAVLALSLLCNRSRSERPVPRSVRPQLGPDLLLPMLRLPAVVQH